tara:strand:+ start:472 stop:885 length:414 start_codon:yes stop_codon:yes gene_type:complete
MTKLELLEDTVKHYSEDTSRRAVVKLESGATECMYTTDDGQHCAVGRWLQPIYKNTDWMDNEGCSANDLLKGCNVNDYRYEVDELFVEGVRHIPAWFWMDLQQLHDNDDFWDEDGLTEAGVEKVDKLREDIQVITGE